jgi:hypothetical protein
MVVAGDEEYGVDVGTRSVRAKFSTLLTLWTVEE